MVRQGDNHGLGHADPAYETAIENALAMLWIRSSCDTRLVGEGSAGTIFKRTRSRPVKKLAATNMQTYIWLLARKPIAVNELISSVRTKIMGVSHRDIAWVVTDMIRDGYLKSGLNADSLGTAK